MKRRIAFLALILIFSASASAQDRATQERELTDRVNTLYQQGKLVEAIKSAESLVKLEKDSTDSDVYAKALLNLARLKLGYFISLQNRIANDQVTPAERREVSETASKNANEAEALLREALRLTETKGEQQTTQTAGIKKDLAWLIYHHSPAGTKTVEQARARIDEAEKLYLDALALSEQVSGKETDETLSIAPDVGDFYYHYVNFEKALPFYERFIQTDEQKHGANHPDLVRALRPYASILFTTFQEREASSVIQRIETITQKKEAAPTGNLSLNLRSKDAVAASEVVNQRYQQALEKFRQQRSADLRTINARNIAGIPAIAMVGVKVVVDENGKVIQATAQTNDAALNARAEAEVSKWTVRPFSYNGTPREMRGILSYREVR